MKKISFIMPNYNTDINILSVSMDSVLKQRYSNLELIIIDDSDENHWNEIQEFAKKDNRVKLIKNASRQGIANALNKALEIATGDYIFRMDADDVCDLERAQITVSYFESHPDVDIVGSQFSYIINNRRSLKKRYLPEDNDDIKVQLLWGTAFAHPSVCFKKNSVDKYHIRYETGEKAEDYNLWVLCAMKGCHFANIHRSLLKYRIHSLQSTQLSNDSIKISNASIRKKLFSYLGIQMTKEQWDIYNKFCDGVRVEAGDLELLDHILVDITKGIPREYANQSSVIKIMGKKHYRYCIKMALSRGCNVAELYRKSEFADMCGERYIKYMVLRILCLLGKIRVS